MAILVVPDEHTETRQFDAVQGFLAARGIALERMPVPAELAADASGDEILRAYRDSLHEYMQRHGYKVADVIVLRPDMPDKERLRAKFLREHTHTEDEVRCFVAGSGVFWFHWQNASTLEDEVFCVECASGDLLSVPAGIRHWFDCGAHPSVIAIRIFTDEAGWVPAYTDSGIENRYVR
jgi:1,2-dihydroxy-3-keto-5-methylthiopentene dioxygenase